MKPRVLLVTGMYPTPTSPYGGIFIGRRVAALRGLGVEVRPLALQVSDRRSMALVRRLLGRAPLRGWATRYQPSEDGDVVYEMATVREGLVDKLLNFATGYRWQVFRFGRLVQRELARGRADVVHAHWAFTTGAATCRAAAKTSTPMLLTCHGSDINVVGSNPRFRSQVVAALDGADEVEFVSQALSNAARRLGWSKSPGHVVPNGIRVVDLKASRRSDNIGQLSQRSEIATVLYVGSLRPIKGADRLPAIIDEVRSRANFPIRVRIVGGGELHSKLAGWALQADDVEVVGPVPPASVAQEMLEADVLVMPSRNEGWPTVALEAHSVGLPVVATDAGGTAEAVGDPRLICPADSEPEVIARRVLDVLEGRILIDSSALVRRAEEFDWERLACRTLAAYGRISHGS